MDRSPSGCVCGCQRQYADQDCNAYRLDWRCHLRPLKCDRVLHIDRRQAVRRLNFLRSCGRAKYDQKWQKEGKVVAAMPPASKRHSRSGTLIGTQLPGKRRARHEPAQVLAPARSRRSQSRGESDRCDCNGYWPCPSCSKSGRPAPADADTSISAREPARNIAAAGNRIPEV